MKRSVTEYRIEAPFEAEPMAIHLHDIQVAPSSRMEESCAVVDTDHSASRGYDLLGQCTVTAAEIYDPLSGLGVEQTQQRLAEIRNESRAP
jgi:hypothetical protein